MPSAWLGPQTNQCRQTRPFTGPWESCDSIRQEHALEITADDDNVGSFRPPKCCLAPNYRKQAPSHHMIGRAPIHKRVPVHQAYWHHQSSRGLEQISMLA